MEAERDDAVQGEAVMRCRESEQAGVEAGASGLEQLPVACALLDEARCLLWLNEPARNLLQLDSDSWRDTYWKVLLASTPDTQEWPDEGVRWNVPQPDGTTLNLRYHLAPLSGEAAGCPGAKYILFLSDAEQLLASMNERVASSLLRVAAQFTSQMAQEIGNPVTALSGAAQLLARLIEKSRAGDVCCQQLLACEQEALCRSIAEESRRLTATLTRFLLLDADSDVGLRNLLETNGLISIL